MNATPTLDNPPPETPALEAVGLEKRYRAAARPALRGVDIRVERGEIFGLLGPNGAGKTTAVSIVSAMIRPDAGRVAIDGVDPFENPMEGRRRFGLAPQEIALYPNLTVRENLSFFAKLYGLRGDALEARVRECLEFVALTDRCDQLVETCSGGMKRRANLAAGLLHSPGLLLLDEPTAGIDAQSRNLILERLETLCRQGAGILYTTHYMEEAQRLCRRVAVIDEGLVLETGEPRDLIRRNPGCADLGDLFLKLTGKRLRDR